MKTEWSLSRDKAIINFSEKYCKNEIEVLGSKAFDSVLSKYIKRSIKTNSKIIRIVNETINNGKDFENLVPQSIKLFKQLLINDSKNIAEDVPEFSEVYNKKSIIRDYVEEIYTYWRNLERYAVIKDDKMEAGILNKNFLDAKEDFDKLLISLYRKVSNNISMTKPNVYRQVPAGANAALILKNGIYKAPAEYEVLNDVAFVKEVVLRAPFITYPKRNKRSGIFREMENPFDRFDFNSDKMFCFPIKVGQNLAYIYVADEFLSHGVSLCNLFEIPRISEIKDNKPNLIVVFGPHDKLEDAKNGYYIDEKNDLIIGYVSKSEDHDYFGYMKKMILTINNVHNIRNTKLPIHGAMVKIELNSGETANIVIVGDSGAGKSESIEAFRTLAAEHISNMTIIFDDMGTFAIEDGKIKAYGTEIGAFVRLDDLDPGYAFKELDRSIFMNPDKINARLITPVSDYDEIIAGEEVDFLLYANNYTITNEKSIEIIDEESIAKDIFIKGRRMSKGTTTENGITESFFANPFGPTQMQDETLEILHDVFEVLKNTGAKIGVIYTQLGVEGMEKAGPKKAALDLFEMIKEKNIAIK